MKLKSIDQYIYIYIYIYRGVQRNNKNIFHNSLVHEEICNFLSIYFVFTHVLYMCMFPACCFHQRTYVAQGFGNLSLIETWTHSCSQFKCFFLFDCAFYIEVNLPFSLSEFTLGCFTPLRYLICFCRCVSMCALDLFWVSLTVIFLLCVCLGDFVCVW